MCGDAACDPGWCVPRSAPGFVCAVRISTYSWMTRCGRWTGRIPLGLCAWPPQNKGRRLQDQAGGALEEGLCASQEGSSSISVPLPLAPLPPPPPQDQRKLPVSRVNGPRFGTTWINSRTPPSSNSGARSPGSGGEAVPVLSTSRHTGRPGARVAHLVLTWEFRAQEPRASRRETAAPPGSSAPRGARAGAGRCVWLAAA